jgi:hypothetical protein
MPTPSLILVPARFKTGKLYTPLATTTGALELGASGDFNVTRATTATRVNASGLIEVVASGIPRLDYLGTSGVASCPALLVEPSGRNEFLNSETETISTAGWAALGRLRCTYASGAAFNGFGSSCRINFDSFTNNFPRASLQYNAVSGDTNVFTLHFKKKTGFYVRINSGNNTNAFQIDLNLETGAIISNTGTASGTTNVIQLADDCFRITFRTTASATGAAGLLQINFYDNSGFNVWTSDGTDFALISGIQRENNVSVPTSYIPTTTAAVTRNAEVIDLSGAVSGCIGQTEGTIYAELDIRSFANGNRIVCLSDGTSDNRIIIQEGANSTLQAIVTNATSGVVDISTASGLTAGIYKIAIGYKQDDFAVYVNGSQTGTDNTGGVPACSQIFIGKIETTATTNQFNDRIRAAVLYTTRLTNTELAALTT